MGRVAPEHSATTTALLWAGVVAAALFVVVGAVEGALRPGYRAASMPLSALSLGSRAWVQIASFVITGAGMLACAIGVAGVLPGDVAGRRWAVALLAAFGVGLVASGVFVMDPPLEGGLTGVGPAGDVADGAADQLASRTWHGVVHDVAGFVVFLSLSAAMLTLGGGLLGTAWGRWIGVVSLVTGAAVLALFVAYVVTSVAAPHIAGVAQRVLVVVGWSGLAWTAALLARS